MTMRALLFLLPLAAHAAANPCDPACDSKAKASAAAFACEPRSVMHTQATGASPVLVHVPVARGTRATHARSISPALVSVGQSERYSPAPIRITHRFAATSAPSATAIGDPTVIRLEGDGESLSDRAQIVRRTRDGDMQVQALDDATREKIRAAVEGAREAARQALQGACEAQRYAHDEMREALREAEITQRDAYEQQREALRGAEQAQQVQRDAGPEARERWQALRAAQEAYGGEWQSEVQARTRDAWKSAQAALAEAGLGSSEEFPQAFGWFEPSGPSKGSAAESDELEDRIRALERIAREQGHDTTDGSLEDRVEALERALGAREAKTMRWRAPRAQTGGALRGYTLQDDGQVREFRLPRGAVEAKPSPRAVIVAPVAPTAPVPPVAPTTPIAPAPPNAGQGTWLHTAPPAPTRLRTPRNAESSGDERRAVEDAMRSLRSEAEALRAELQCLREKVDSLPRDDAR